MLALSLRSQRVDLLLVLAADVPDVAQPVVGEPDLVAAQSGHHSRAAVVPADDDVAHPQDLHGELDGGETVQIGVHDHVGDVAMDEHLPREQAHDLVGRHTAVRAPDPEVVGCLLAGKAGEEVRILARHLRRPGTIVREQVIEGRHQNVVSRACARPCPRLNS